MIAHYFKNDFFSLGIRNHHRNAHPDRNHQNAADAQNWSSMDGNLLTVVLNPFHILDMDDLLLVTQTHIDVIAL